MMSSAELAEIGSLVGDPTRAVMLSVLMDGRALTAGELAYFARVPAQTTSLHLRKLTEANLLSVVDRGRHRYFRIASPLVAHMLETIVTIGAVQAPPRYRPRSQADAALRTARLCYDHLAGRLAVAMADALIERAAVTLGPEGGEVTPEGVRFLASLGVHIDNERRMRRAFCRPCLDFTERRFHIAGFVGAALARHCLDAGWVKRMRDSRAVSITPMGQTEFLRTMGIDLGALAEAA